MAHEAEIPQRKLPYRRWAVVVLMFSGIAIILFGCSVGQMLAEYGSFSDSWPVFIGGLFLIGLAVAFWLPMRRFVSTSKETDAKVTGRYTKEVFVPLAMEYGDVVDKERRYWLVFQFSTENRQILARAQVKKSLFERKRKGSLLSIRYSAHEPLILQIEGEF